MLSVLERQALLCVLKLLWGFFVAAFGERFAMLLGVGNKGEERKNNIWSSIKAITSFAIFCLVWLDGTDMSQREECYCCSGVTGATYSCEKNLQP